MEFKGRSWDDVRRLQDQQVAQKKGSDLEFLHDVESIQNISDQRDEVPQNTLPPVTELWLSARESELMSAEASSSDESLPQWHTVLTRLANAAWLISLAFVSFGILIVILLLAMTSDSKGLEKAFGGLICLSMLALVFVSFFAAFNRDPRESASGRWGLKARRFLSGDWGGEKWGEGPRGKNRSSSQQQPQKRGSSA